MKKFILGLGLAASIIFGLVGCGSESVIEESASETYEPDLSFKAEEAIKIKDIDWNLSNSLVDGNRKLLFSYTNNSKYTIMEVKIEFAPKEDTTLSDLSALGALATDDEIKELGQYISQLKMSSDSDRFVEPGETAIGSECYIGSHKIQTSDQCAFMEPDIITIAFIGDDGFGYEISYDFVYDIYGTSSDGPVSLREWSESEISTMLPVTDFPVVEVRTDREDKFSFDAYGVTKEAYDNYTNALADFGFTYNLSNADDGFNVRNENGFFVEVTYDLAEREMYLCISNDNDGSETESTVEETPAPVATSNVRDISFDFWKVVNDCTDAWADVYDILSTIGNADETTFTADELQEIEKQGLEYSEAFENAFAECENVQPATKDEAEYIISALTEVLEDMCELNELYGYNMGVDYDSLDDMKSELYDMYMVLFE